MKRVVVFGAGRRVLGAVLPALGCLRDRFVVDAVIARSVRTVSVGGTAITTRDTTAGLDWASVDLIVVAVPMPQVAKVLAALAREPVSRAVLMLDTPVLPPAALRAGRHFAAFRRVLVSEDVLALPPYLLARKLIDAGAIGAVQRVLLFHSGFKYHGLASIKLLAGATSIARMTSRRFGGKRKTKDVVLDRGVTAVMYEPRDYAIGTFLVQGDRGAIADDALPGAHRIGYQLAGPIYRGLTLDGEPVPPAGLDAAYLAGVGTDVVDASPMNTMKLRGLMDLLVAAVADEASPLHYPPAAGLADDLAYRIADRVGWFAGGAPLERALALAAPQRAGR